MIFEMINRYVYGYILMKYFESGLVVMLASVIASVLSV